MTRALSILFLLLFAALPGCQSPGHPGPIEVAPGSYETAFNAVKESLRDHRFQLDRIDAASGVITTRPKTTGGFMTPWDDEQTTLGQEWSDMLNQQSRQVRIVFSPVGPATPAIAGTPAPPPASAATAASTTTPSDGPGPQPSQNPADTPPVDLREYTGPLQADVEVTISRTTRPNWRIQTKSVTHSSYYRDPVAVERGFGFDYEVPVTRDPDLSARLADEIRRRLAKP